MKKFLIVFLATILSVSIFNSIEFLTLENLDEAITVNITDNSIQYITDIQVELINEQDTCSYFELGEGVKFELSNETFQLFEAFIHPENALNRIKNQYESEILEMFYISNWEHGELNKNNAHLFYEMINHYIFSSETVSENIKSLSFYINYYVNNLLNVKRLQLVSEYNNIQDINTLDKIRMLIPITATIMQSQVAIDGPCKYTLPPYNEYVILDPENPKEVSEQTPIRIIKKVNHE